MVQGTVSSVNAQGFPICNLGPPDQPLSKKFSPVVGKLCNQRATEVGGVPGEMIKYSANAIAKELTNILNADLTSGCDID